MLTQYAGSLLTDIEASTSIEEKLLDARLLESALAVSNTLTYESSMTVYKGYLYKICFFLGLVLKIKNQSDALLYSQREA
jgi:RNA 3'-terminal phosphate cyclase